LAGRRGNLTFAEPRHLRCDRCRKLQGSVYLCASLTGSSKTRCADWSIALCRAPEVSRVCGTKGAISDTKW